MAVALKISRGHCKGVRYIPNALLTKRCYGLINRKWEHKRFYKKADVYKDNEAAVDVLYGVNLDHRPLRTPLKRRLLVPSETLAFAVAQEWEKQGEYIETHYMHLTHLCNTAIDKPVHKTTSQQINYLLPYLDTDVVRCVISQGSEDFVRLQHQEWYPVVNWFNSKLATDVEVSEHLLPQPIPGKDISRIIDYLQGLNHWKLTSFAYGVESSKSLILTLAMCEDHITALRAAELSLLESLYQAKRWGKVEWSHDMDFEDLSCKLSAVKLLTLLT